MRKFGLLFLSSLLIISCSRYATHGENVYSKSKNGPSITVPSSLTHANNNHFYDLHTPDKNVEIAIAPPDIEIKTIS